MFWKALRSALKDHRSRSSPSRLARSRSSSLTCAKRIAAQRRACRDATHDVVVLETRTGGNELADNDVSFRPTRLSRLLRCRPPSRHASSPGRSGGQPRSVAKSLRDTHQLPRPRRLSLAVASSSSLVSFEELHVNERPAAIASPASTSARAGHLAHDSTRCACRRIDTPWAR